MSARQQSSTSPITAQSGQPLRVVAVTGSVTAPSRTRVLLDEIVESLHELVPIEARHIELRELVPGLAGAVQRQQLSPLALEAVEAIETADVLVVASPVYRGSYSGLFKHLFDFVHHESLIDVPVLLAATGGSDRHALVIDHQLRPLFSFFQARTLPLGVYASEQDFSGYQLTSKALHERIDLAVTRALPLLTPRVREDSHYAISRAA